MKIGNLIDKLGLAPGQTAASNRPGVNDATGAQQGPKATQGAGAPAESVTVKLSSTAASLLAGGTPEFNAEKVAAIRQAIAEGTFHPNPEVIADKLIANAQELLSGLPSSH